MLPRFFQRRQFSLATLLVVVTVFAFVAAAYGMYRRTEIAEDRALTRIAAKGGCILVFADRIYVGFSIPPGEIPSKCAFPLERTYKPTGSLIYFTDDDLALFDHVRGPLIVDLRHSNVTPEGAARFRSKHPDAYVKH